MKNQYLKYPFITLILCLATASIILLISVLSCRSTPTPAPTPAPTPSPAPAPAPRPVPAPPTGPSVSVGEARTTVGEVVTVEITIDGAAGGISGYDLTVSLTDERVTQIVDIVLPDFGLTDISKLPSNKVTIRAVDLKDIIPSGTGEALIATLKLQGIGLGVREINVTVNAMDDDNGDPMEPRILPGSIEVVPKKP